MSWDDECWEERERLVYIAQMNRLYHHREERFFSILDRTSKALALIAGSAAASTLLGSEVSKAWAGFAVACVTLPALVFAWSDRARLHAELASDYTHLEAEIEGAGVLDWPKLDAIKARLVSVGAKESPELASLIVACQNELAIAAGQPDKVKPLDWKRRWFKHFFSMPLGGDA
ncbi:hypothetical protein H0A73_22585 [Alcaligenaceae bacterium]|nr:hypothetical protein [Alcaligenaceae bacterium]